MICRMQFGIVFCGWDTTLGRLDEKSPGVLEVKNRRSSRYSDLEHREGVLVGQRSYEQMAVTDLNICDF